MAIATPVRHPRGDEPGAPALPLYFSDPGRAVAEFGLLLGALPLRRMLPRGDGHPVLVLPGLLAGDDSTWALRRILRDLGYRVHGWRLGRNFGPTAAAVTGMAERLQTLNSRYGAAISVIGWSLGGIYARALARNTPDAVRQVLTMGSPFRLADERQSRASRVFNRYTNLHVRRTKLPAELDVEALPVPATSIYSRYDGIVAWQACLDPPSPRSENIAVIGSHFGYGHNPAVVYAVADRLAQPPGTWAPFSPPRGLRPLFPRPDTAPDRPSATPPPRTMSAADNQPE
ncbi:MAG: alpha/beta hydrolase [Mycobacteriaceae bacterium]|nr:alpha/beta hydrolase [Mycobacteriaceae bacterium]MBV9641140.1 alpha/beta hydrolase [Mycobacteriaceae bacterium]